MYKYGIINTVKEGLKREECGYVIAEKE